MITDLSSLDQGHHIHLTSYLAEYVFDNVEHEVCLVLNLIRHLSNSQQYARHFY